MPQGLNEANIPVYSGKIVVKGSNGDRLSVPYAGELCQVKLLFP